MGGAKDKPAELRLNMLKLTSCEKTPTGIKCPPNSWSLKGKNSGRDQTSPQIPKT